MSFFGVIHSMHFNVFGGVVIAIFKRIFYTVLITVSLLLLILLAGVRVFGVTPYTVISGSMEPTYHVGSIVYVKSVEAADLKAGDPVTYRQPTGTVVTHRIVEVENSGGAPVFKTKGDANNVADEGVLYGSYVIGKPVFTIPLLGYVADFVQNPPGLYIVVGGVLILVLLSFLSPAEEAEAKKEDGQTSENSN